MKRINSKWAITYTAALRAKRKRGPVTWVDVANAYDDGLDHAVWLHHDNRTRLVRYMRALRVMNAARKEQQ